MATEPIALRDLASLPECRAVVSVQEAVWGRDSETVPASVLFISAKRGGILIGAFHTGPRGTVVDEPRGTVVGGLEPADGTLVGFVWSLPGVRDGKPVHWSHMLGVLPDFRGAGVAERLKFAQRQRALAAGVDLIEWTFDPLQAANAHLNLHVLGARGATYGVDVYGNLSGPLHRGTPTDRLIVEWWIREPQVEERVRNRQGHRPIAVAPGADPSDAPAAVRTVKEGEWIRCAGVENAWTRPRVLVPVPPRFSEMQQQAPDLAMEWRLAVRQVMTEALAAGYRAVDFQLDRERGGGMYILRRA